MKLSSVAGRGSTARLSSSAALLAGALAVALCAGAAASGAPTPTSTRDGRGTGPTLLATPSSHERSRYTVVLADAPLAAYDGTIAGYPAPQRRQDGAHAGRIDVASTSARAWLGRLEQRQDAFVADLSASLGRPLAVAARLRHAINAIIVELTDDEALAVASRDGVRFVERDRALEPLTDRGPAFIGAPSIWDGSASNGTATQGEGVVVAVLDSGINWKSPAFAPVGPVDGYVHVNPLGAGNYLGLCGPTTPNADIGRCSDKLIGMYNFVSTLDTRSATDDDGHGSHTASTAAGNVWDAPFGGRTFRISGVAPHANLIAYKVCTGTCPNSAIMQAANQAVADGMVDVLNLSISGGVSPWTDVVSFALLGAHDAGIVVATSAGNGGPDPGTAEHQEPWTISTASVQHDRLLGFRLSATAPGTPPPEMQDIPLRPGKPPTQSATLYDIPIIQSPGFSNGAPDGCTATGAFPPNTFRRAWTPPPERIFVDGFDPPVAQPPVSGVAVLNNAPGAAPGCDTGERLSNAINAGAVGVIFVDREYFNLGASGNVWSMRRSDWDALASLDPATVTVTISLPARSYPRTGDLMPPSSGRGPRALPNAQWLVKPDLSAPGVDVLAAWQAHAAPAEDATATAIDSGTSMSAPHVAGAAALLRALHPAWTPTQVKSALTLVAKTSGVVIANGQPATAWDRGAGRVDVAAAAKTGLALDETGANFLAANPATGGNLSSLNLPSLASGTCVGTCTYARTVRRVRDGVQTYTATAEGYAPGVVDVAPGTFMLDTNETQVLTITVHSELLVPQQWSLGDVVLKPADLGEPVLHLPVAMRPGGPAIQVAPAVVSGSGDGDQRTITISNVGNPTLEWSITASGTVPVTPLNTVNASNGQQAGYYNGSAKGYYWAQNFDVKAATRVTSMRASGFTLPSTSMNTGNTPLVTFSVYADANGMPAGAPQNFGAPPLWTYANAIGAANGISALSGTLALNLGAAPLASNPLQLAPGRYWLMVWPTLNGMGNATPGNSIWAWRNSADPQIGAQPRAYIPSDDPLNWRVDPTLKTLAAQVQGTVDCQQPAWISYSATGGSAGYGGSSTINATFDADGLAEGTYYATLCIGSNATNTPVVVVPLTFHVPGDPM